MSRLHPIAETASITVAGLAAVVASVLAVPGPPGWLGAGLALLMLAISVVDARHLIIPNAFTAAAFGLALLNAGLQDWETVTQAVLAASLRGAVLGAAFLVLRVLYRRLRGRQGIGLGDVKLAVVAGAWLDWTTIPMAVEIAALAALASFALRHLVSGRPLDRMQRLPFGLFLAPAIWLCWLVEMTLLAS